MLESNNAPILPPSPAPGPLTGPSLFDRDDRPAPARPRCGCGEPVDPFWRYCPWCGLSQPFRRPAAPGPPTSAATACRICGWFTSPLHPYCPWCRHPQPVAEGLGLPLAAAPGFRIDAPCDWACGGGVQYPMPHCPWCGERQDWGAGRFEGVCAHCSNGVDDWMPWCPWCGKDAAGNDLLRPALERVEQLLAISGVPAWDYRVLLRPGVSGVDPAFPRIVEINRGLVGRRPPDPVRWEMLAGLILHELGHSFLYHHPAWTHSEVFRVAFGDVDAPYLVPDTVEVEFGDARFPIIPTGFASHYGVYHPQEDFAETFRYYVLRGGRMGELREEAARTRKLPVVSARFSALDTFLGLLRAESESGS